MTGEKKTETLDAAATRLLNVISDLADTVAEPLCECIACGFRCADEAVRKLIKALDPRWQRREGGERR